MVVVVNMLNENLPILLLEYTSSLPVIETDKVKSTKNFNQS